MTEKRSEALLVIDMQNSFCHPQGALYRPHGAPIPGLPSLTATGAELVHQARGHGVPVLFTRQSHRVGHPDVGGPLSRHRAHMTETGALVRGSWDADIVEELTPRADEFVVDKLRYDAFHGTELDQLLRSLGTRRLVICGILTNACVESTARAAAMRDFAVTVVPSACGSRTADFHRMSLSCMEAFGIAELDDAPFDVPTDGTPSSARR